MQRELAAFKCYLHGTHLELLLLQDGHITEEKPPVSYKKAQVLLLPLEKDTLAHLPHDEAQAERFKAILASLMYSCSLGLINISEY